MNELYCDWQKKVKNGRDISGSEDRFLDRVLDQVEAGKLETGEHAIFCGTLMEGGSDTTSLIIIAFIYALTKWPEVQVKAQKQANEIVGEDRSLTWQDYGSLPYVAACVKESMRWRPILDS
jgi:cytochrome P450